MSRTSSLPCGRRSGAALLAVFVVVVPLCATAESPGKETPVGSAPAATDALPTGVRPLYATTLRNSSNRDYPYPTRGQRLVANPPVFTWPMSDFEYPTAFPKQPKFLPLDRYARYEFQLSRSPEFPSASTTVASGLRLPFFNPHHRLESGTWYWRFRVELSGAQVKWSDTQEVMITSTTPVMESLNAKEAFAHLPKQYPRVHGAYATLKQTEWNRDQLNELRQTAQASLMRQPSDFVTRGEPIPAHATPQEVLQIEKFRKIYEISALCEAIDALIKCSVLDSRNDFRVKAIELSSELLRQDPAKTYAFADFAGSAMMTTLATVYDLHVWSQAPALRAPYEKAIAATIALIMSQHLEDNIGGADGILSEHFFQHLFLDTFKATISLHDRISEAPTWFALLYEIWLARTPGGGFLNDGAWPNGNQGYLQVNLESMVQNYLFFRDIFGVNLFAHPWYQACGHALIYTVPPGSPGDGFGDGAENLAPPGGLRADFAYILGRETGNPYALRYAFQAKDIPLDQPYRFERKSFRSYRLINHMGDPVRSAPLTDLPSSALLAETGMVAMHTTLATPSTNLFLAFRSSPFGVGSHGHADQNAFNLISKGEPLFYSTGYRVTTQDKHYLANQKHTRSKNTLTVDGKTQAFGDNGYGWIARYLHGTQISYALGDASRAYQPFPRGSVNWITVCRNAGIYTAEQGFIVRPEDDPQVKQFRRHIALLRPSTVIVYDELEAAKAVTWEWHLNTRGNAPLVIDDRERTITANGVRSDARAHLFASTALRMDPLRDYFVTPVDWLNPQRGRAVRKFDPAHHHSLTANADKTIAMRFFAIIEIDESNTLTFTRLVPNEDGAYAINGYRIQAELDLNRPARLEVIDPATGAHLLYGEGNQGFAQRNFSRSTVLFERTTGQLESADTWPLMVPPAVHDNQLPANRASSP